ncbi:MAG: argininosuccinate synthase [Dehalococcoidia bacterium]|nr:argininosuccinate synthase [Dehalococcoidia bacterium]MDP7239661.1 argininosuccinate synthase [Dehalococcoidia bacterium]MDP7469592.1 argininosuccinate synthase [Dehalococcoidia bacterium]
MAERVVLAYSGGLDTSVAIRWLKEKYGYDVVTLTIDLGGKDVAGVREKALEVGAVKAEVVDAGELFARSYVFPALKAGAVYQGQYPLATALGRPLIASLLAEVAMEEAATAVAHGCTGKGNDQVRFEVSLAALAPQLKVVAPAREWGMTREETIHYARERDIPVPVTVSSPYSTDENLWGRSIECGVLEDPWAEPPEDAYSWTRSVTAAPEQPVYVEIGFEQGVPALLDGRERGASALLTELNTLAGEHGVGRIDHIEDRLVGIKSREVYEAPAATVLLQAHAALESLTLSRQQLRFKEGVAQEYAALIYDGLWFSAMRHDLDAYVESTQRFVSGKVRVKLLKGAATVVGRRAPHSLYNHGLATYDKGDEFDQSAASGFIHLWGLPLKVQAQSQLREEDDR